MGLLARHSSFNVQRKITFMLIWCIVVGLILLLGGNKIAARYSGKALAAYSAGGSLAEEALSAIRYTTALGMQRDILTRYSSQIKTAEKHGFRLKSFMGAMVGFAVGICRRNWSAAFSVLGVGANAGVFVSAVAAGERVFSLIDHISPVDSSSADGLVIGDDIVGQIEFQVVKHIYPSRPSVMVKDNLTLTFRLGQMTAIVDRLEPGKAQLDIFSSVMENIAYGLVGTKFENQTPEKRQQTIENAARLAGAHDFIMQLPDGYLTRVGARGSKLSGAQKQRIAIARAIIGQPKILVLDEATSALDTTTEIQVQNTLKAIRSTCTTIVIAHRMSTIQGADNIIVLDRGRIVEQGCAGVLQRLALARALVQRPAILLLVEATSAVDAKSEKLIQEALDSASESRTTLTIAHRLSTVKNADFIYVLDQGRIIEAGSHDELVARRGKYFHLYTRGEE
ncbi:leptomycin B resistance protein pmd1 [Penicillium odoratum]|uniref:leptomycin B resistance protein pmd1 n=1 Tax=Penicillium odoratum TaxID=1167516 RepID=UPI0025484289|nr:leptomycin B resistance protein pmd1 [Penicillium odoratum]KAJ5759199.1 leptomycin B resistance protein pmd1 [Penicillium odoratum]